MIFNMDPAIWLCVAFIKEVFDTLLYFLGYASGPRAQVKRRRHPCVDIN